METLSDKIYKQAPGSERLPDSISTEDIKESIKKLRDRLHLDNFQLMRLKEIFGEKLT